MATKQVDMIAQVGEMLSRMAKGEYAIPGTKSHSYENSDDQTIVLASAMLAIAGELREINNSLAALAVPDKTFLSDGAGEA